jgi:hypothetical protein
MIPSQWIQIMPRKIYAPLKDSIKYLLEQTIRRRKMIYIEIDLHKRHLFSTVCIQSLGLGSGDYPADFTVQAMNGDVRLLFDFEWYINS